MEKNELKENKNLITRPPVVVVMGHVDHGKSTLLDYIRKSNIVSSEAGGITQHISAYEVTHKDENGENKLITFLDTPGHEAFSKMRERGAFAADVAILVVSAEDSVKAQTLEAYKTIIESKIPYIVAINKIDRPNANVEKTKMDLIEKGIYLEGLGGDIPFVPISAKEGLGIDELLELIILVSDLQELKGDPSLEGEGVVIEANRDPKRGISATCIIKNGTIKSGMFMVAGDSMVNTRIMENFLGKQIKEATFSSPVRLVGFDSVPEVGTSFYSFNSKKEAEDYISQNKKESVEISDKFVSEERKDIKNIPIIIKTDVMGTIEAIKKEIEKINTDEIYFKIIGSGAGSISESDLRMASIDKESIIIGFNVKLDNTTRELNETFKINIQTFDIIYKLTDWLKELIEERRPRQEVCETTGSIKVLKTFGDTKGKKVIGGKVVSGKICQGSSVKILRRDFEIGSGKIVELQMNKIKSKEIAEGCECGILIESKIDISSGDILESFIKVIK